MNGSPPLARWKTAGLAAAIAIVASCPLHLAREAIRKPQPRPLIAAEATFVGRERCAKCHQKTTESWTGSDHDWAMAEATTETVLGDFADTVFEHEGIRSRFFMRNGRYFVSTEGPGGEIGEFAIDYTFGWDPLQQYLVHFPGGRLQALSIAWDVPRRRWFHLYPGTRIPASDWLHWTRNAQNWNGMCAECHSTNLKKGYDPATDTYQTTWFEIDVSCEACHGPGSRHVAWAEIPPMGRPALDNAGLVIRTGGMSAREEVELCAACHSRRTELGDYDHTRPALLDNHLPALLAAGLYHPDGQILEEVYVYGSFVQSKMFRMGVRCTDCHDAHSLKLLRQGNDLCLQCHQAETYDAYGHHFHQKTWQGKPSDGALCVKCHMPERPYMVIDWRADHSLRVPRPDLTAEIGVPNACSQAGCHGDKPLRWVVDADEKWYGKARKPHYGPVLAAGRRADPAADDALLRLAADRLSPTIVRATALSLLDLYPGPDTEAALRRALLDDDALLRHTAVRATTIGDPRERAALLAPLLSDPARAVRLEAAAALAGTPAELLKPYQYEALAAAIADYRRAMEYSLDFAASAYNLGNLSTRLGEGRQAEEYYRRAIAIDDLFFPAKANLAVILSAQGRNDEAETLLRQVVDAYPENSEASYSLGLLLAEMGRPEEAEPFLASAARGMPANARVHYNRGLLLSALGRDEEAERALARAVELDPASYDVLFGLGDFYLRRGRFREARAIADRMLTVRPHDQTALEIRARASDLPSRPPSGGQAPPAR